MASSCELFARFSWLEDHILSSLVSILNEFHALQQVSHRVSDFQILLSICPFWGAGKCQAPGCYEGKVRPHSSKLFPNQFSWCKVWYLTHKIWMRPGMGLRRIGVLAVCLECQRQLSDNALQLEVLGTEKWLLVTQGDLLVLLCERTTFVLSSWRVCSSQWCFEHSISCSVSHDCTFSEACYTSVWKLQRHHVLTWLLAAGLTARTLSRE